MTYAGPAGYFAPLQLNDGLTLDLENRDEFEGHHYAFHVSDDDIFAQINAEGITFGSGPRDLDDLDLTIAAVGGVSTS